MTKIFIEDENWKMSVTALDYNTSFEISLSDFGKTVFLEEEEAEEALNDKIMSQFWCYEISAGTTRKEWNDFISEFQKLF